MNKKEWKDNHKAARYIYSGYMLMITGEHGSKNDIARDSVWTAIEDLGMREVICGKGPYKYYPLRANKWAVKHNCRNY